MATLADAVLKLRSDGRYVQGIFITIDPERDTPDLLSRYVMAFHPTFLGLSGDAVATERVAKEFKVAYQKILGRESGSYSMDHSAGMFVFDLKGNLRLYVRHGQDSDGLAHDLRELLCESSADLPELRGCSWRLRAG